MAKKIEKPTEPYKPPQKKYYFLNRPAITIYPVPYVLTPYEKMILVSAINDLKQFICRQN